ncbi:MAG: NAD-dependent epimerase/dehydratase family protein [FCB group bacterium]|nr:NAD-dependent epimerase/dehydratase family protein [FCB group bacterium]
MKILITGGAGLIGSNLTDFHLRKNDQVTVIDNFITSSKKNIESFEQNKNFFFIKADIIQNPFQTIKNNFDLIYHLASPASPIQYWRYPLETLMANSQGTDNLFQFGLKNKQAPIVIASTSEVYGDPAIHPQPETYYGNVNSYGERSCYDEGKRFAEALAYTYTNKYKLDIRIARIFNTYGPNMERNDGRVISNFINQTLTNQPITIYGDGKQTRSFCYVDDMVFGLYLLGIKKSPQERIVNFGNPDEKSMIELAKIIKELTESQSKIVFKPIKGDDPQRRKPDIGRARTMLNWQPKIDLETGLLKTINYFKQRFYQ